MDNWIKILSLLTRLLESVLDFLKHPFKRRKHPKNRHKGGKENDE